MDAMDLDIEMDVDVDLVPDEPIITEPESHSHSGNLSPGEIVDANSLERTIVPNKLHIRGLETLNTEEVKSYVLEHFPDSPVERIEWIDDSSANIIFSSEYNTTRALSSLAIEGTHDSARYVPQPHLVEPVPAKPFASRPDVVLRIRPALSTDKKQAGAASRSRFYLLNPEYDPEERRRRNEARRYRDRDSDGYNRRRVREARHQDSLDRFDVSLYDDDEVTLSNRAVQSRPRRRRSFTPDTNDDRRELVPHRNENRGKELFPSSPSTRDDVRQARSASPSDWDGIRATNGILDGSDGSAERNRNTARAMKSRLYRAKTRELFPDTLATGIGRLGDDVDDTTTLLAKGIMLPLMDETSDTPAVTGRLEDRITVPGHDRFPGQASGTEDRQEFNIRGTATQRSTNQGFSIKGSAGRSARELFPEKLGQNAGKELFTDGLERRTRQRQRAGDLFD